MDTNVIIEGYRTQSWRALTHGYQVETVEDCITETQTGFQRRREEERIDRGELIKSLAAVHEVSDAQRAVVSVRASDIALDEGEHALWAHALARSDAWVLCGPDRASLRFGVRAGFRERMISLETLLTDAGHNLKLPIRENHTAKWLDRVLGDLVISEGARRP